jgi:hypothetical protein
VLRSTARAACDTEVNSGRRGSGEAIIAVSTKAAAPTMPKPHPNSFSGNHTIHFRMTLLLESMNVEYSVPQS